MKWEDANKACESLGNGWRLPTKDELNLLYLNRDAIGGFSNGVYWSSTENGTYNYYFVAWFQNFYDGFQGNLANKDKAFTVRAIRSF
jgi:hypothetical protein